MGPEYVWGAAEGALEYNTKRQNDDKFLKSIELYVR